MFVAVWAYKHVTDPIASNYSEHSQVSVIQIWTDCSKFGICDKQFVVHNIIVYNYWKWLFRLFVRIFWSCFLCCCCCSSVLLWLCEFI